MTSWLAAIYQISPSWYAGAMVYYLRLISDASDSPIGTQRGPATRSLTEGHLRIPLIAPVLPRPHMAPKRTLALYASETTIENQSFRTAPVPANQQDRTVDSGPDFAGVERAALRPPVIFAFVLLVCLLRD
ncbi:MipA/OmpV family protein [Paraburkholderia kirstenboschensis]|uniref:MipA/OmpV family protein n=1 Tax=Paraburkholderia kirstenboschensis TaxID=1245436 RepID=UPI001FB448CD|nr:MipA/OmpV family protein [Paraburkholderia kirstenboschensis]